MCLSFCVCVERDAGRETVGAFPQKEDGNGGTECVFLQLTAETAEGSLSQDHLLKLSLS